jgi:hypothetical protein
VRSIHSARARRNLSCHCIVVPSHASQITSD